MTPFLLALPWLGILLFVRFVARVPSELPEVGEPDEAGVTGRSEPAARPRGRPSVSVIVPARNEVVNIVACLRSLTRSDWPDFEVIVVDDRSQDGTAELARSVPSGNASRVEVMRGEPLPEGWLGKPWACRQGAERATGQLLLFTDADTTHGRDLLHRAVAGMEEEDADLMTVVGRQLMGSFWERLVQPQIFMLMLFRFPNFERVARNRRWRDAIANGQFLLFRREAYEAIGGHEVVRDEVAEDLALAQHVKRAGLRLRIRSAERSLATRMYRSLGHLVEGWSKNIIMGGLQSFPRPLRPFVPPMSLLGGLLLWIVPPLALATGLFGSGWAAAVCALSAATWMYFTHRMGAPFPYGLLYPVGAAVVTYIFVRAWVRGRDVEWKGRRYHLRPVSERA
jgi:chlorobactene glucosyltransferase